MKAKHILKGIASGLIWGLGQVFNKQFIKAAFFFVFFVVLISIEFSSGRYFETIDPYDNIEEGTDFDEQYATNFVALYDQTWADFLKDEEKYVVDEYRTEGINYEEYVARQGKSLDTWLTENNISKENFSMQNLISYLAYNISENSKPKYTVIANGAKQEILETADNKNDYERISLYDKYYVIDGKIYRTGRKDVYVEEENAVKSFNCLINISDSEDYIIESEYRSDLKYAGTFSIEYSNDLYFSSDYQTLYVQATKTELVTSTTDELEQVVTTIYPTKQELDNYDFSNSLTESTGLLPISSISVLDNKLLVYNEKEDQYFGYYNPLNSNYNPTLFSKFVTKYFNTNVYTKFANYKSADYAKFLLRVYFEMNPEDKEFFETNFSNFFSYNAGFFVKGLWAIVTLGEVKTTTYGQTDLLKRALYPTAFRQQGMSTDNIKADTYKTIVVSGDTSEYVLLRGLISTLLLCYFLIIFFWTIRDAYKTSIKRDETGETEKDVEWFKEVYENAFEYIVLLPALFCLTFITVMPIIYGFLVAFTSYSGYASDSVGAMIDWVGFKNFTQIFTFGGEASLPFARVFWRVLGWTVVWAVFSTFTVFFGGFFQALIINSDRVPFKKFWRTILILPWAIPSIISQMVFSVIFNENGIINKVFERAGVYDILIKWGMLGRPLNSDASFFERLTFLGIDNIQWFNNPANPTFVRVVIIVVNIWLGFPYYMALMSGVMTSIDKSLYEAADIDGATKGQKLKYITFPLVLFSTAPLLVMCFSGNFNNFGVIYFMTGGGANKTLSNAFAGDTDILISWMYTLTVDQKIYNMASVFSILIFILVGSISAWNYSRTKSFKEEY